MHLRSVPEVSTSFFSCGDTFPFHFSFFQYDLCLILLTIFLCFPFVVPRHFCSSPHTWGYPSSLLTRWISLAGVRTMCFLSFWEKIIQKTDVWSVFGRWDAQNVHQLWCSEVGLTLKIFSFSWHWTSCLILDPNFSEPNVSGYCFYTYLSVLNNSWCPESQLPSIFHTAAI